MSPVDPTKEKIAYKNINLKVTAYEILNDVKDNINAQRKELGGFESEKSLSDTIITIHELIYKAVKELDPLLSETFEKLESIPPKEGTIGISATKTAHKAVKSLKRAFINLFRRNFTFSYSIFLAGNFYFAANEAERPTMTPILPDTDVMVITEKEDKENEE